MKIVVLIVVWDQLYTTPRGSSVCHEVLSNVVRQIAYLEHGPFLNCMLLVVCVHLD